MHSTAEDANTTEVANSFNEDSMAENSDTNLDVTEREYNADVDMDPAIDDVAYNDIDGRVGLGGGFRGDIGGVAGTSIAGDLSAAGAAQSCSEVAVVESYRQGIQQNQRSVPRSGIAEAVTDCIVAGISREQVAEGQEGHCGVVAGGGVAENGVAYVVDNQIKAVGKVDHTRKVLHGHQIKSGYVCVQVSHVQSENVLAPLILGDKEENSLLKKGMLFVFPVSKLFKLGKLLAGEKVVLQRYVP